MPPVGPEDPWRLYYVGEAGALACRFGSLGFRVWGLGFRI